MAFTMVEGPEPRPPGVWPPQANEWIAEYNQRSAYNESEIVRLIKEIFDLLILFGYVRADHIVWAPTDGHAINETLCTQFNMDPSVVSLVRKIPYIVRNPYGRGDWDFHLFPASPQVTYLDDDNFRDSRDAEVGGPQAGVVESQDLKLTDCMMYGTSVILDTTENVIRLVSPQDSQELCHPLAKPENESHYRNAYGRHAPSFLRRYISRIRSLSMIPIHSHGAGTLAGVADFCDEYYHDYLSPRMKEILKDSFGYPDHFRHVQWLAEREEIWENTIDEMDEEYGGS